MKELEFESCLDSSNRNRQINGCFKLQIEINSNLM